VLLENHGALSFGVDLMNAYFKMESLEFYAQLLYLSTQLGGPKEIPKDEVQRLYELRKKFNMPGRHPGDLCGVTGCACVNAKKEEAAKNENADLEKMVAEITRRIMSEMK